MTLPFSPPTVWRTPWDDEAPDDFDEPWDDPITDQRDELEMAGAYDRDDECWSCGAPLDGGGHYRFCAVGDPGLRAVS